MAAWNASEKKSEATSRISWQELGRDGELFGLCLPQRGFVTLVMKKPQVQVVEII